MKPVMFADSNAVIGAGQKEYLPIPARIEFDDRTHPTTACWKLSLRERIKVLLTGRVWQTSLTFGNHYQPQRMSVDRPQWNS